MTGSAAGEPGRGVDAPTRTTRTRGAASAIVILLALGLAFRLIFAYLNPNSGFAADLGAFRFWAANLAQEGPYGFYERDFFHDYTPGYLYVLWGLGIVGKALGGLGDLVKLPAIVADLALAWIVHAMVVELSGRRRAALVGAAIVLFNPVTWFDSVLWGQVDSVGVVFLLLGVRELWRGRHERAAILAVVAALVKPQLGILAPIVAVVTIRRALRPEAGGERRPLTILTTGIAGLATVFVMSIPFGLSVVEPSPVFPYVDSDLLRQVLSTAAGYPYVTVNAYNPWALVSVDGTGLAANGVWLCDAPGLPQCGEGWLDVAIAGIPAVVVGTVLFVAVLAVVLWAVARRPDPPTILVAVIVLAVAFFVVPTRVHERYMFPFFPLAAILVPVSPRWRSPYAVLAGATFVNMYAILTTYHPSPSTPDWLGIGRSLREEPVVAAVALLHLAGLAWTLGQLRRDAADRLASEIATGEVAEPRPEPGPLPREPGARPAPETARPVPPPTAWSSTMTGPAAGPWADLRRRVLARPIRADRSRALHGEGGGRLDRLDLWLLAVLVVGVLCLRVFRLSEPYQMHFDEVYHARTATEFLQDWRYGEDHSIYEYTHPHLAKYAMAAGIVLFGENEVSATSDLGTPVRDAIVEPRRDDETLPDRRAGDRAYVATGSEVRAYDLATRRLVATIAAPGATTLALDAAGHRLFIGTESGEVRVVDTSVELDWLRIVPEDEPLIVAEPFVDAGGPVTALLATDDGSGLAAVTGDEVVLVDGNDGTERGRVPVADPVDLAPAGTVGVLHAVPFEIGDPAAAAATLADLLGRPAADLEALLRSEADDVVVAGRFDAETRDAVDEAIADGRLAGFDFRPEPRIAVAGRDGLTFVAPAAGIATGSLDLGGEVSGLDLVTGVDENSLYVAHGEEVAVVTVAPDDPDREPFVTTHLPMPGAVERVVFDRATELVHVEGAAPGEPGGDRRTIYVIEPHGNSVFADAAIPFRPVAIAADVAPSHPAADRQELLAFSPDGEVAVVEAGRNAFAWRLPGVVAGVLMAAVLFLLARILFRRRSVAVLAGLFAAVDGMLFVQSRIAMNDAYVGLFILAAYAVFAALWTGRWRHPAAFWLAMPVVGGLLGLALASKWVAAYAIAAMGVLILSRSALGRLLLVAGLVAATTVLGYMAVSVPAGATSGGNLFFLLLMIGLTLLAVVASVLRPIAWSTDELRLAVGAGPVAGLLLVLVALAAGRLETEVALGPLAVTPLQAALALALLGGLVAAGFRVAGRAGFGPLAPPPGRDDPALLAGPPSPAPAGWLNLGWGLGLGAAWTAACLLALPVAIYVASYVPWALLDGHQLVPGWPPGHEGQTLADLTRGMYDYHNNLRATHAASSPWWAWPFDLKPVWFYQGSFAEGTAGAIYDAGNLVIWWLGIPALAFCAWQAWKRRSLGLAFVMIAFAWQWLPWVRIDRATFQYHYYASLPFVILALAYLLAELWHGASARTWLLARASAAAAVLGPVLLWIGKAPLCGFVRVEAVNAGSQACVGNPGELVVTVRVAALVLVVGLAVAAVVWQLVRLDADGEDGDGPPALRARLAGLGLTVGAALVAVLLVGLVPDDVRLLAVSGFAAELVALVLAVPLGAFALFVLTARDARRFVSGVAVAAVVMFVAWYPNLSALPLPATVVNAYQGVLPTYLYPFQFPVNMDPVGGSVRLLAAEPAILLVALAVTCAIVAYSAWVWRIALAERALAGRGERYDVGGKVA